VTTPFKILLKIIISKVLIDYRGLSTNQLPPQPLQGGEYQVQATMTGGRRINNLPFVGVLA
jgi:hypothetical protein